MPTRRFSFVRCLASCYYIVSDRNQNEIAAKFDFQIIFDRLSFFDNDNDDTVWSLVWAVAPRIYFYRSHRVSLISRYHLSSAYYRISFDKIWIFHFIRMLNWRRLLLLLDPPKAEVMSMKRTKIGKARKTKNTVREWYRSQGRTQDDEQQKYD